MKKASPEQLEKIGILAASMVKPGDRVGLGSGKASLAFVRALGQRFQNEKLDALGVPTSLLTEKVARESGIRLATLDQVDALDIYIDGADEVDPDLNLIKGGGGNLTREKVICSIARKFVVVVGGEKIVPRLGTTFPVFIECIEFARPVIIRKLESLGSKVEQRKNPDGSPFITDNGNPYLQVTLPAEQMADVAKLDLSMHQIPGILETGLFIGRAAEVLIAHIDGRIEHKIARTKR